MVDFAWVILLHVIMDVSDVLGLVTGIKVCACHLPTEFIIVSSPRFNPT